LLKDGGPGRDRTDDLFHAMEARSQLRHRPTLEGGDLHRQKLFSLSGGFKSNRLNPAGVTCIPLCMASNDESELRGPDAVSRTSHPRTGTKSSMLWLLIFVGILVLIAVFLWARRAEKPVENNPDTVSSLVLSRT
jgi:LPXTG-motif cell wall-anchored protein